MRIAVVGAGLAGVLLAWRLHQVSARVSVELLSAPATPPADATGASGGLVRGFETAAVSCRQAAESMAELRSSATLREWSGYREVGSVYLLAPGGPPPESLATVQRLLPGSATVLPRGALAAGFPFRDLPAGTVGVFERCAGYISPDRLRAAVLAELVTSAGVAVRRAVVTAVTPAPAVVTADGVRRGYDAVVVATGAWTPRLLAGSGLPVGTLRTKQIQYTLWPGQPAGLGAFVDDVTGCYGRPVDSASFLLGLPSRRWGVDPAAVRPDPALVGSVRAAGRRLGLLTAGGPLKTVASYDCYHDPPGLALRRVGPGPALLTFTGGSGGAAKAALAASREAAAVLAGSRTAVTR